MIHYQGSALNQFDDAATGNAFVNATITVRKYFTNALAELYSDDGVTPIDNPVTANNVGYYEFWVATGDYNIVFNEGLVSQRTLTNVSIGDATNATVATLDELKASSPRPGQIINLIERDNAKYKITAYGATPQAGDVLLDNNFVAELLPMPDGSYNVLQGGADGSGDSDFDNTDIFQGLYDRNKKLYIPTGTYYLSQLAISGGSKIVGDGHELTILEKIPDTDGDLIFSDYEPGAKDCYLYGFAIDGNRGSYAEDGLDDGIHFEGGASAGRSAVMYDVWVTATTGTGIYFGPNRNAPNLQYCYSYNVGSLIIDSASSGKGNGIHIDSLSDAYVGVGCGFGSAANRSVLAARSATPVFSECEIWWANNRANIEIFECKGYTVRGCNIDRTRNAGLRIQGRAGSGLDAPADYFEAGIVEGNGFLFPRGDGGAGTDGDSNFIEVYNAIGVNFTSNHFITQLGGEEIKVDYLIYTSGCSNLGWTGNAAAPEGDDYCAFVSGVTNDPTVLFADMTETLKNFRGSTNVIAESPSYRLQADGSQNANNKKSRIRVEDNSDGDIVWEALTDDEVSREVFLRFQRNGFNIFEAILGGMLNIETYANTGALPAVGDRSQWSFAIVEDNGSGDPAFALNDGTSWRLNSFT